MDRPALQKLLADVQARRIDVIVVYKVDRLTRSLADFAKLVEMFDGHDVSFVSVTQSFNTTTSVGRLTLNVLLSFAQFEREVTGERIRDKIAASKKKGMWMGGVVPLGYRVEDRALHIVEDHAEMVRSLFRRYLEAGSVVRLKQQLDAEGFRLPIRVDGAGRSTGGGLLSRGHIYKILSNAIYVGRVDHKGHVHRGHAHRRRVGGRQRDRPHRPHALPFRRRSALFRLPRRGERDRLRPARRQAVRAGALFSLPALLSPSARQPERGHAEALDAPRDQDQATPRRQCRNSLAVSAEAEGDVAANP